MRMHAVGLSNQFGYVFFEKYAKHTKQCTLQDTLYSALQQEQKQSVHLEALIQCGLALYLPIPGLSAKSLRKEVSAGVRTLDLAQKSPPKACESS